MYTTPLTVLAASQGLASEAVSSLVGMSSAVRAWSGLRGTTTAYLLGLDNFSHKSYSFTDPALSLADAKVFVGM